MPQQAIGRLTNERRSVARREEEARATIASHFAFDKDERRALKSLERRRTVRRRRDLRDRLAALDG